MAISADYPKPITVNGFVCLNCDDVSDAKRFIDPATSKGDAVATREPVSAVSFGGNLVRDPTSVRAAAAAAPLLDRYA